MATRHRLSRGVHRSEEFRQQQIGIASLTPREREIVLLVADGLANKDIATELCISSTTVRRHLTSIFGKVGISSRFELIVVCYRHRLVVPPEATSSAPLYGVR